MKSDMIALLCDLCGAKTVAESLKESRWLEFAFEDKEKHLCVACVNMIAAKIDAERTAAKGTP